MNEKQISKFLEEQTAQIKVLYINLQKSYWNAATTGKKEFYQQYEQYQKETAKFFNSSENFKKVKEFLEFKTTNPLINRQLEVLYNNYLSNQGDLELLNKIVEKSTAIEQKFNLFRAKVNGKELSDNEIKNILREETDSKKLQEAWEASKKQGEIVAKDLIELIKLRNQLARSLGFENYYLLALETNEQKEKDIKKIFDDVEKATKNTFKKLKDELDEFLKKRYKVSELKPWHYQDLFFQEDPKNYGVNLNEFYNEDILEKAKKFYLSIGIDISKILERSDLYERKDKYQHACCMDMDREGDVRTIMNIKNTEKWMETVLHELGHGSYQLFIDKNLPFLIKDNAHTLTTEAIAQLFGRNSKNIYFIEKFCNIKKEILDKIAEDIAETLRLRQLIFSRWSQVMFNFEKELYKNPEQDLNKLWWSMVKKYQLIDFSRDMPDWASKIHFVSSPVYYHNYLIGELFASQINNHIAKKILGENSIKNIDYSGKKQIGDYLKSNIFQPGMTCKWNELIKNSTGEELNPKYYVEEFC